MGYGLFQLVYDCSTSELIFTVNIDTKCIAISSTDGYNIIIVFCKNGKATVSLINSRWSIPEKPRNVM